MKPEDTPAVSPLPRIVRDPARLNWPGFLVVQGDVFIEVSAGTPKNCEDSRLVAEKVAAALHAPTPDAQATEPQERLRYALQECYTLAVREARKEQKADSSRSSRWNHIIRFCKDADTDGSICNTSGILREASGDERSDPAAPVPSGQEELGLEATQELLEDLSRLYPLPDDDARIERCGRTAAVVKRWMARTMVDIEQTMIPTILQKVRPVAAPATAIEGVWTAEQLAAEPFIQHDGPTVEGLIRAIERIEENGICRIDLDCLALSEENILRNFLGVLQDGAHGYDESDPEQPRLSKQLRDHRTLLETAQQEMQAERTHLHNLLTEAVSLISPERHSKLCAAIDAVLQPCSEAGVCVPLAQKGTR